MLPDFFFCSLFPVQQTTSGIGHPCKVVFRVGNHYAECDKQRQQQTTLPKVVPTIHIIIIEQAKVDADSIQKYQYILCYGSHTLSCRVKYVD